jgi:molybdenum cofactor cytidylyltransferase
MPPTLPPGALRTSSEVGFSGLLASQLVAGRLGAVILAAGASERMGTPKALLPWGGTTLIEHAVRQARAAGVEHVVVVLGPATRHLADAPWLAEASVTFNPDPGTGRSASIRIGSQGLPDDLEAIVMQSVDQPCDADVLARLCAALAADAGVDVAVPTYAGRRGHPVCLSGRLLAELRQVTEEEQGLRSIVKRHAQVEVSVDTPCVVWNLNDPAAYAAARAAAEPA